MMLQVWSVTHRDIESSELRGLFRSERAAIECRDQTEGHIWTGSGGRTGVWFNRHGDWCCSVSEEWVRDEAPEQYHGPEQPAPLRTDWAGSIIPLSFETQLFDLFRREFPVTPAKGIVHTYPEEGRHGDR